MKNNELEKFIQNQSPDLYSFAYVLIPDDLQATQLMIDSVSRLLIQKKSLVESWVKKNVETEVESNDYLQNDILLNLLKSTYEISKKRYSQLKISLSDQVGVNSQFFTLDFEDKAVLFLKEKLNFEMASIEFVTGLSKSEILAHLYSARILLSEKLDKKRESILPQERN
jgi:hypothetical protein